MYGTCEILCRELAAKYPADTLRIFMKGDHSITSIEIG